MSNSYESCFSEAPLLLFVYAFDIPSSFILNPPIKPLSISAFAPFNVAPVIVPVAVTSCENIFLITAESAKTFSTSSSFAVMLFATILSAFTVRSVSIYPSKVSIVLL